MSYLRRTWIKQLRRLAYKIEDCIDNFRAERISSEEFATMITNLNKSAEETKDKLLFYTREEPKQKTQDPDEVSSNPDHSVVLGMEEPSDELKALLCESLRSSERKLRVIFIIGFGGTGKTLLAQKIYEEQCNQFPRHAFVHMSGRDTKEVLKEIIKKLQLQTQETVKKSEQGEAVNSRNNPTDLPQFVVTGVHGNASVSSGHEAVQQMSDSRTCLRSCLGSNRYLIVIDDIWAEELCHDIISAFPRQEEVDSRIIVTTTIQSVAQSCGSGNSHVYKMRPLNDEMSKKLFVKVACGDQPISDPQQRQSSEFLKKCDGVPLALVSIAQYCNVDLSRCEEAWRKLCKPENHYKLARMQRVLDHSYDSLSSLALQDCLLYLCMFPWGHQIKRGALIRRWLAEGLALPEDGRRIIPMVDAAVSNFNTLVDRNVIRSIHVSIKGEVKTCQPPGVMLGYITSKSEAENFFMLSCGDETLNPEEIRRLSLHCTDDADNAWDLLRGDLSRLRTLAVFDRGDKHPLSLCKETKKLSLRLFKEKKKHPLSFANCKLLRVLDLQEYPGLRTDHLEEISNLRLLKYLSLSAAITMVPSRIIANLKWLETLQMDKDTVVTVPADILKLPCLKYLLGKLKLREGDSEDKKVINFLKKDSNLEKLAGFVTGHSPGFQLLMPHMRRLRKVKIWYSSNDSPGNLSNLSQCIKEFLHKAESTSRIHHTLSVDLDQCSVQLLNSVFSPDNLPDDENHPGGLFSLKLQGMLNPVPAFVINLRGITKLCLSSATLSWNAIVAAVSNLKILEYLKLVADNIEGDVVIQCEQFISMKRLWLVAEQSVSQITIHTGALKHLVSLHLLCPVRDDHTGLLPCVWFLNELTL